MNFRDHFEEIVSKVSAYYPDFGPIEEAKIESAFFFAAAAHENQKRYSGEKYFSHPIAATKILLSIQPDIDTISACLLHDVIEDTKISADEIEKKFGKNVRFLCEGVEKISKVRLSKNEKNHQFENLQKLFVAVAKDIRVIFVKLADRIHNLQTLHFVPEKKQKRIAHESIEIYAPVAAKLGLFEFKTEIQDLCFKFLYPREFKKISDEIFATKKERQKIIDAAKKKIEEIFRAENFNFLEIFGRQKNFYSIFEKLKKKNLSSALEIYDLFGIRILTENLSDCYRALGILHSHFRPVPGRFKDYISVPKPNGYQSLHTTVLGLGKNLLLEIQIRTKKMHLDAEFGPAAHWAYKKARKSNFDEDYIKRANWFPQNIPFENKKNPKKFFEDIADAILAKRIYVFTPKGNIKTLPARSTPVDFAYSVHSEIGASCIGARVNGIIRPLNYELKNGEIVEIITKKGRTPNPLWINFVKSSIAKNHIRSFINKLKINYEEKNLKIEKKEKKIIPEKKEIEKKESRKKIIIGGEIGIPYKIAKCCHPDFGKNIVAYKGRGLDFVIHEENCPQLKKLNPERFSEAYFLAKTSFLVKARDRIGLLRDYTKNIAECGINIINTNLNFESDGEISCWTFSVEYGSEFELQNLFAQLQKISDVIFVKKI